MKKSSSTQRSAVVAAPTAPVSLGTKRSCPKCSTKFYDFNKSPILCPKCDEEIDPLKSSVIAKIQAEAKKKPVEKSSSDEPEVEESGDAFESVDDLAGDDDEEVVDVDVDADDGDDDEN